MESIRTASIENSQVQSAIKVDLTTNRPVWQEMSDTGIPVLASNFEPEVRYDQESIEAIEKVNWKAGGPNSIKNKIKTDEKFKPGDIVYHKAKEMYITLGKPEGEDRSKWQATSMDTFFIEEPEKLLV